MHEPGSARAALEHGAETLILHAGPRPGQAGTVAALHRRLARMVPADIGLVTVNELLTPP